MFNALVVDDEPPFVRQITRLLEAGQSRIRVAATAFHGAEALEKLEQNDVHLLITDVRMPLMDGIELIRRAHGICPWLESVIVSGYADFAYAKGALKAGASDYILKPIRPEQFAETLQEILKKLDAARAAMREALLDDLIADVPLSERRARLCLPAGTYLGLAALDGWFVQPSHFFTDNGRQQVFGDILLKELGALYGEGRVHPELIGSNAWFVLMRDPPDVPPSRALEALAKRVPDVTLAFARSGPTVGGIASQLPALLRGVRADARISGAHLAQPAHAPGQPLAAGPEKADLFAKIVQAGLRDRFFEELDKTVALWRARSARQMEAVSLFRQLVRLIRLRFERGLRYDIEREMEYAISSVTSFDELYAAMRVLADEGFLSAARKGRGVSGLFEQVEKYVGDYMSSPITLSGIAEIMHVSQPVVSRVVRERTGQSFNEYVTTRRMERARALIRDQRDMTMRDIAEMLGYPDQHYFSRVFKSLYGLTPSEFRGR